MRSISRYFAIAAAAIAFLAMVGTSLLYRYNATRDLVEVAEHQNIVLARVMSNSIWSMFGPYLSSLADTDPVALRDNPETKQIDAIIRGLTRDLSILKVKIYTADGLTAYSSEVSQIGEIHAAEGAFQSAATQGTSQSKLSFRDEFSAFSGEVFHRDVVETYFPITAGRDQIFGVFELYSDVTRLKTRIDETTIVMGAGLIIVFISLYGALVLLIMRRAIAPLRLASSRAALISSQTPEIRLPAEGMPSELVPLITAVNDALDRLDIALAAQRRFTADAAHELLTPLAVLHARIDTLEDDAAGNELRRDVIAISDVVTQLLQLSELETLEPQPGVAADIGAVCGDVIAELEPIARKAEKTLQLTKPAHAVVVHGHEKIWARVIRNIVDNAIAHTPPNTAVDIRVSDDGTITIADQGSGIRPEDRDHIFERFWRGARESQRPGAGLGLAIVKQSVEAFGGDIAVSDAPDGGALFTIRLPVADSK
jgi:signal transduction histidine kinase